MKKIICFIAILAMLFSILSGCTSKKETPATPSNGQQNTETTTTDNAAEAAALEGSTYAKEALAAAKSYEVDSYFDNFDGYKDFNEDGKLKVAFVCKFLTSSWFAPKSAAMQARADELGVEYIGIDANSSEDAFMQGLQNAINQKVDAVVLTPVDATMLPACVELLQEAGIAYITTDDGGYDANGNRLPHLGLDDYGLCYGSGKAMGEAAVERGFDVKSLKIAMLDVPSSDSIHRRSLGAYQAMMDTIPGLTDDNFLWIDTVDGLTDNCINKLSGAYQANAASAAYWMVYCGGDSVWNSAFPVLDEGGADYNKVIVGGVCADTTIVDAMAGSAEKAASIFVSGIMAAPSGVALIDLCNELFTKGTPFPNFSGYPEYIVSAENVNQWVADLAANS